MQDAGSSGSNDTQVSGYEAEINKQKGKRIESVISK